MNNNSDQHPSMKNCSVPMSPFRVDYAGDVVDIGKSSGNESLDHGNDLVASTESETEVPEMEDEPLTETTIKSSSPTTILKPTTVIESANKANSCQSNNDQTTLTELDSLSSSVHSSAEVEEETKAEPPSAATASATAATSEEVPPTTPTPRNSRVSFSQIHIREYPIIVGDNPSVLTGTPITIDWDHVDEMEFHLDDYEQAKVAPRTMVELRMPAKHRDSILKSQGFSMSERNHGKKLANLTKNRRKRTSETMKLCKAAEAVETWKRATRNATWGRKRKQQERRLLHPFRASSGSIYDVPRSSCSISMASDFLDASERTI